MVQIKELYPFLPTIVLHGYLVICEICWLFVLFGQFFGFLSFIWLPRKNKWIFHPFYGESKKEKLIHNWELNNFFNSFFFLLFFFLLLTYCSSTNSEFCLFSEKLKRADFYMINNSEVWYWFPMNCNCIWLKFILFFLSFLDQCFF